MERLRSKPPNWQVKIGGELYSIHDFDYVRMTYGDIVLHGFQIMARFQLLGRGDPIPGDWGDYIVSIAKGDIVEAFVVPVKRVSLFAEQLTRLREIFKQ